MLHTMFMKPYLSRMVLNLREVLPLPLDNLIVFGRNPVLHTLKFLEIFFGIISICNLAGFSKLNAR